MSDKYSSLSPYNYSFNQPNMVVDVNGADPNDYYFYGGYFTYDDWIPQRNLGWFQPYDRSSAGGRAFGESLVTYYQGGNGWWRRDLTLDLNAMSDGAHFFSLTNGLVTSYNYLSNKAIGDLGSAYSLALVGGYVGPIVSDYTGGARLWQSDFGNYATKAADGSYTIPYTNLAYVPSIFVFAELPVSGTLRDNDLPGLVKKKAKFKP